MRPALAFPLALLMALSAQADDILHMANGDRLTGQILDMRDGVLNLSTAYADSIAVDWASVVRVETDEPVFLEPLDSPPTPGRLLPVGDVQGIETSDGWRELDLASVTLVTQEAVESNTLEAVEDVVEESAPLWSGAASTGITFRSGNTDTLDIAFSLDGERKGERDTLTLGVSGAYGEVEDVLNTRRHLLAAKWQYYPHEKGYVFVEGLEEQDDGRKLDLRIRAAAGLGYDFIGNERTQFSGDLGLSHTWEEWNAFTPAGRDAARDSIRSAGANQLRSLAMGLADGSISATLQTTRDLLAAVLDVRDPLRDAEARSEQFMNLQLGLYLEQKILEHSVFTERLILRPSLEDFGEVQIHSQMAFVTPLRERLDLRIALESAYDSTADESGVDPWDHILVTGLRYAF